MSKGFLIFAKNTENIDYVRQSCALALSIKYSQSNINNISIVTNDSIPDEFADLFDQIIPIPWYKENENDPLAAEHRWKMYHATPYDETIVLDSDMLVLDDISTWWDYCSNYDIKFCSRIKNYKLETVVDTVHRQAFIQNKLTNPYFALHYFKKSDSAHEFYRCLEFVCKNWQWCWTKFAPEMYQDWCSMDLASAIAIELSQLHSLALDQVAPLEFVHMKSAIQGWDPIPSSWQNTVPVVLNRKGELVVGNIRQSRIFHYVEKDFISDNILTRLKELNERIS